MITAPIRSGLGSFFGTAMAGGIHSGLTLVGEQGPELVDFTSPSRVYTASQTEGLMSGGGTTFNFAPTITGGDREQIRQEMELIFPLWESRIATDILVNMRRNVSPFRDAIKRG